MVPLKNIDKQEKEKEIRRKEKYRKCFIELWKACFISEDMEEMEQAFKEIKEKYGETVTCEVAGQLLNALKERMRIIKNQEEK